MSHQNSITQQQSSQPCLHQLQLKGHKAPVLSLCHSSSIVYPSIPHTKKSQPNASTTPAPSCLLSGSEDGTARLWDLRCSNSFRASLCILAPLQQDGGNDVTAVGFHPMVDNKIGNAANPSSSSVSDTNEMTHTTYSCPFTAYMTVGSNVYGYDLRNANAPIIKQHDFHLNQLSGGEEINEISFYHFHKKKPVQMAVADDDGYVRITQDIPNRASSSSSSTSQIPTQQSTTPTKATKSSSSTNRSCRTLQHDVIQDGSTLVTSCAFRPGRTMKTTDIVSGGTDCKVNLWDIDRPRHPSSTYHVQPYDEEGQENQIYNPPLVQSLSWSPSGRLVAAGLGDGTCLLLSLEGRRLVESCRLYGGHTATVASVVFPQFGFSPSSSTLFSSSSIGHVTAEDRLLISGGNDGSIFLWDLGSRVCGPDSVDPSTMFVGYSNEQEGDMNINNDMKNMSLGRAKTEQGTTSPKILYHIPHEKKPNRIVTSKAIEPALASSLFVADTSSDITVYVLPRQ